MSDDSQRFASPRQEPPRPLPSVPPLLPHPADQRTIFRWFFFGVFAFLLYQLILILSLFGNVIIWACSLSLVFWPAYKQIERRWPNRNLAAGLCTGAVLLLVLVPVIVVFWIVGVQSTQLYPTVQNWLSSIEASEGIDVVAMLPDFLSVPLQNLLDWIEQTPLFASFDFEQYLLRSVQGGSLLLANLGAATARNLLFALINLMLILALMYFCFRDGERFLRWFLDILPMENDHARAVALRVYETVTAVIRAALITASVQGALALIGYIIAGVPLALLFGVLTGFAALIPVVGAGLVWLPLGIFIFTQTPGWGIFLLAWGFFAVSMIDNLLKPILIGNQAKMPILLIFCAMLGGANVYGVTGFIVGPILIALLLAFITIYREYYLPENGPLYLPEDEAANEIKNPDR
ncbi:MAG: AI-2E family transporter [Pseudomonadales bacterium]|jgi:predicted PurR-regulated permease PerM|nr:AI-2E family transporter [Pseudomonadales bacterium]